MSKEEQYQRPVLEEYMFRVRDLLIKLKETSELMVDLAYSALMFNSREIAEEVRYLENYVDDLYTQYEALVISMIRHPEDPAKYIGMLRLGESAERIADASAQMADLVLRGIKPHPVYQLVVEEAEETITRIEVEKGSRLDGETLKGVRLQDVTGMRVIAIRRGSKWIFNPSGKTRLEAGDILIARGDPDGEEKLEELAKGLGET